MTIQFTKNPTGRYNLSYEVGEVVTLPDSQAMDIVTDGYAIVIPDKPQNASSKQVKEKR